MNAEIRSVWFDGDICEVEADFGHREGSDVMAPLRATEMWRARTIMKVTPWGDGTLFEAAHAAIATMQDPLERAAAEEVLERGSTFDLDGQVAPRLMEAVGVDEPTALDLIAKAAALPA